MSAEVLQPDSIKLRPGEQPMPMNYEITRYQPFCGNEQCVKDVHFDQMPPTRCKHGRGYYLDKDYEAAKRITADNPTGAPRKLVSSSPQETFVDFTQLPAFKQITQEQPDTPPAEDPPVVALDPLGDIFGP